MTRVAMFTAAAAAAGLVGRFGGGIVPFSLEPFVCLLAGCTLGARAGSASMALYVCLGLAGIPIFSSPPYGGIVYLAKPTFGYLLGFILAAGVAGVLSYPRHRATRPGLALVPAALAGVACIYLVGLPYLGVALALLGIHRGLSYVLSIGFWPFIGLDLVKALVAAFLAAAIRRRLDKGAWD